MIRYESDCVDCGQPCIRNACPHYSNPHYYCDECKDETGIYEFEDKELCLSCIERKLKKVGE